MAITTRYFTTPATAWVTSTVYAVNDYVLGTDNLNYRCISGHTSSAGDRPITGGSWATYWELCDGTSWTKRAVLFPNSANWSSIISGFNFTADSLVCYVGPGTYNHSQAFSSSVTGTPDPSASFPIFFYACDANGDPWRPPNPNWTADMPVWDTTGMPVLTQTTNTYSLGLSNSVFYGFKISSSARTGGALIAGGALNWCVVENTASNTAAQGVSGLSANGSANLVIRMTSGTYDLGITTTGNHLWNLRVEGPGKSASGSGNRNGIMLASNSTIRFCRVVSVRHPGHGLLLNSTGSSVGVYADGMVLADNGGDGLNVLTGGTATFQSPMHRAIIVNNTGYGVDENGALSQTWLFDSRMRDNGLGNFDTSDSIPLNTVYTDAGTDADEFVDVASGDYRIKASSVLATKPVGISVAKPVVAA